MFNSLIISFYYFAVAVGFLLSLWWIYLPCFLLLILRDVWINYRRTQFIESREWVLLEVVPPRDIIKTPKAMEQIFSNLHTIYLPPDAYKANVKGEVQAWLSFEIASLAGELHFFIRCMAHQRNLVESNIYSQYPEAEIHQVDDYIQNVPQELPDKDYDVWGTEMVLEKDNAYPILTYPYFGRDAAIEEQRIDPVASLLEAMGKMGDGEQFWLQMLVRPLKGEDKDKKIGWKVESEKLRDKLIGREQKKTSGLFEDVWAEINNFMEDIKDILIQLITGESPGLGGEAGKKEESAEPPFLWRSTKHEQTVINLVEEKMSKLGFETIIRWLYVGNRDVFNYPRAVQGVFGAFRQFSGQHVNSLNFNKKTISVITYGYQGKTIKEKYRKKRLFRDYVKRNFVIHSETIPNQKYLLYERLPIFRWFFIRSKPMVLNTEELASLYHFPSMTVKAPTTPKVEAKKGEPPVGLPVG